MGQGSQKTPNRSRDPKGRKFHKKKQKDVTFIGFVRITQCTPFTNLIL